MKLDRRDRAPGCCVLVMLSRRPRRRRREQKPAEQKPPSTYDKIWGRVHRTGTTTRKTRSSSASSSPAASTTTSPSSTPTRASTRNGTSAACGSGRASRCFATTWCTPRSKSIRRSAIRSTCASPTPTWPGRSTRRLVDHRRQAERAVHAGRRDLVEGAAHDRSQQPRQQHLVRAGIHARRQRVGPRRAVDVSRRRVFVGRDEPRVRRLQRRRLHAGVLGYDFAKKLGVREAVLTGNYLYQQPGRRTTPSRKRFEHITSVHFRLEEAAWGARGRTCRRPSGYLGQRDLLGVMADAVFQRRPTSCSSSTRYTFVDSDGNNGVSLRDL